MASQTEVIRTTAPEVRTDFIATESLRIEERLEEIVDDYEGLLAECDLIADGASLLNSAVSWSSYLPILHTEPV